MADVLLATEDITVLGGPASISVDLDFGPEGERGSLWYTSPLGNPNTNQIGVTPKVFDMCINTDSGDADYQYIYQYRNVSGTNTWVKIFKLISNTYSVNRTVTFIAGEKNINIPVSSIISLDQIGTVTSANFNVQYSITSTSNPVSSSLSLLPLTTESGTGNLVLPLSFNAIEFDGGEWVNLDKEVTIHLFITVV
jgi:hypothetical protein